MSIVYLFIYLSDSFFLATLHKTLRAYLAKIFWQDYT